MHSLMSLHKAVSQKTNNRPLCIYCHYSYILRDIQSVDQLVAIFARNGNLIDIASYKMPQKIYGDYKEHVYGLLKKKCEKGVNFGRVKKRMNRHEIWGLFKGYWFHSAPKEMTKHLWVPLLRDIARYFAVEIGDKHGYNNCKRWPKHQIEEFVKFTVCL